MRRLHVRALPDDGGVVTLDDATSRHASVLRLAVGDSVTLFDGAGHEADARIVSVDGLVVCDASAPREASVRVPRVVLVQCLAKGEKLDDVVRGATEAGVHAVHLAAASRDVAKWDAERTDAKLERLARVAKEAARQSLRATVPEVLAPAPLAEVCALAPKTAARLVLAPGATHSVLALAGDETWLVVGPEGGLDAAELDALERAGWRRASLGPYVLRTEHAGMVAVALAIAARA